MEPDPPKAPTPDGAAESHHRAVPPAAPRCPGCGWQDVRFSRSRSVIDSALGMFSISPFRCRSCGMRFRRFYRKTEDA